MLTTVLFTMCAGAFAGGIGALLGIGGGVFLVPFLHFVIGLDAKSAGGISLITVIATSSITSATPGRLQMVNLRLAMVLEIFTSTGALAGVFLFGLLSDHALDGVFGGTMVAIMLVMLTRIGRRNVLPGDGHDVGALGGRFHEDESGGVVSYRVKRLPVASAASFAAGLISRLGIGGGVVTVPVLNAWCGIPIRVATATSALMLGATAMIGAVDSYQHGQIVFELAAAAVVGVLLGSRAGLAIADRSKAQLHKVILTVALAVVAAVYFYYFFFGRAR